MFTLQVYFYISISNSPGEYNELPAHNDNVLLWWTPFVNENGRIITCDNNIQCFLTSDRNYKEDPRLKALLFYGTLFNKSDLPLARNKNLLWGLLHEESPRNTPILSHDAILSLFNYSSTFSRYSNLPLTLQYLPSLYELNSKKYFLSLEEKTKLEENLAPVIYLQSDCVTPNNRDSYVYELMKYIKIDSYGICLNNKQLPLSLTNPLETMMAEELFNFVSQYKFAIAFENAICEDYITEKLWRPLIAGTIPIYHGSPSVKDWLPNNKSAILIQDFDTPKQLADYLIILSQNTTAYDSYRAHKINEKIDNKFLIKNFRNYEWSTTEDSLSIIEEFECLLCRKLFSKEINIINIEHYNCPKPVSMLDRKYNISNWWHRDYHVTKCEAISLRKYIDNFNENVVHTFNYIYNNDEKC